MTFDELIAKSDLQPHHYELKSHSVPIINASVYTIIGKRLYELYKQHGISSEDQREIERINFLLMSYVLSRSLQKPSLWARFRMFWSKRYAG